MKTYTNFPLCEKHELLRTLTNGSVVVSSAALHDHLGGVKYRKFIAGLIKPMSSEPTLGFRPETVEAFLDA